MAEQLKGMPVQVYIDDGWSWILRRLHYLPDFSTRAWRPDFQSAPRTSPGLKKKNSPEKRKPVR